MLMLLSGCGLYIGEEQSKDFKNLSQQYDAYIDQDISNEKLFYELINGAMVEVMPSIVEIEISVYSNLNILVEKRISSGVIFEQLNEGYFVLIDQSQTTVLQGQKLEYRIIDFMNNTYMAQHLYSDELEPITILYMTSKSTKLRKISIASFTPKVGEPVLLMGNHFGIQNATAMGLITSYRPDLNRMYTSIPSDASSHGGAIINNQLELIGIQTTLLDDTSVFISLNVIKDILSKYHN